MIDMFSCLLWIFDKRAVYITKLIDKFISLHL